MTMLIQPLTEALLRLLPPPNLQAGLRARFDDPGYVAALCRPGCGWALSEESGAVVMVGGVVPVWPGRGLAWFAAIPDTHWRHWRAALDFAGNAVLPGQPYRRIEATVLAGFAPGCRWAEALGFSREGLMRGFGEAGEDFWLYARVRR